MEGPSSHRDLIPVGKLLRRHVYKHVDVGVFTPWDDGSDGEDPEGMIEWKTRWKQFYFDNPLGVWSTSYVVEQDVGVANYRRIGRSIRVLGIDMSLEMRLSSLMTGTMIGSGADYAVTLRPDGPAAIRVLLVVNHGASTHPTSEDIFNDETFIGSGFDESKFQNYCCIFDKTYVFSGIGDVILDHVFIDCDFTVTYPDATGIQYPLENDVEFRYFVEDGVNSQPVNHVMFRFWYEDY